MYKMSSLEIHDVIKGLNTIIPKIQRYICPTLNSMYDLQTSLGCLNITKTEVSDCGLWQLTICDTCQTSNFHTEDDCTYTVISTPNQDYEDIRAEPNVFYIPN